MASATGKHAASVATLLDARERLGQMLPVLAMYRLPPPPVLDQHAGPGESAGGTGEIPGMKRFESTIIKEIEWIDKMAETPFLDSKPPPPSNAPHLLALCRALTRAPYPIVALNAQFTLRRVSPPLATAPKATKAPPAKSSEVKVHIVAGPSGSVWIRVIAITNVRLLFEFLESDSYVNSDESFSDSASDSSSTRFLKATPSFDSRHLRTSLHKTAHQLLQASSLLEPRPSIQLHLPRLSPSQDQDGRVRRTIKELSSLGVDVVLSEDEASESANIAITTPLTDSVASSLVHPPPPMALRPGRQIALDLSVLIALVSDIVHAPLPENGPEGVYRSLIRMYNKDGTRREEGREARLGQNENMRALTIQLTSELEAPLIDEIVRFAGPSSNPSSHDHPVEFWATSESRDRLAMIVEKLGGPTEKHRAAALFARETDSDEFVATERARSFWATSRYEGSLTATHLALSSIRLTAPPMDHLARPSTSDRTLHAALTALDISHPDSPPVITPSAFPPPTSFSKKNAHFSQLLLPLRSMLLPPSTSERPKPAPSLTPHTLRTLLFAAERGISTLSANRASARSLWKVFENYNGPGGGDPSLGTTACGSEAIVPVLWIVEPRSLGESMRLAEGEQDS